MAKKPKAIRPKNQTQSERFIETARKLGVDETGATFEKSFTKIVPPKKPKK